MFGLREAKRGKIMTCQDDLIEFREAMESLKKEKGGSKQQFKSEDSKFTNDANRS
jgi:hypothetical protein